MAHSSNRASRLTQRASNRGRGRAHNRAQRLASGIRGGLAISPLVALLASPALADPEGAQVAAGSATFDRNGSVTTIHAADRTIINYSGFDIASFETVRFVQPGPNARVLNRINSASPTRIDGTLMANGRVYLANPAGVIFGKGSVVNAAGIYAAAGSIADRDFLQGVDRFTDLQGDVINHGSIYADTVHLLGRHVANFGSIEARDVVTLMAGDEVLIGERGGHIYARMNADQLATQAQALGESGTMLARGDVYSVAIHDLSSIRAQSVQVHADIVTARGVIDASATAPGQMGGRVELLGDRVAVDGARIDVSGHSGGGDVRIGGGFRGQDASLRNAQQTLVTPTTTINADATVSGDGGTVVVWSDRATGFGGTVSAAGAGTGDGGMVEVSGKKGLAYQGKVSTPGGELGGSDGTLLLDPEDITVVADGTGDSITLTDVDNFTDPDTNLDGDSFPNEIEASVITSATSDVILQAERDITFDAVLVMDNAGIGLMAEAGRNITVNQPITTLGGDVTLIANAAGAAVQQDGSITINAAIDTAGGGGIGGAIDLVIDGGLGRVNLLADLVTDGGSVLIDGPMRLTGDRTVDTAGLSTTAGNITLTGTAEPSDAASSLDLDARATITGGDVTLAEVTGSDLDLLTSLDVRTAADGGGSGVIGLQGDVLTGGDQRYDGFVVVETADATLTATGGEIEFGDALSLGSNNTSIRATDIDFGGAVTGGVSTPPSLLLGTVTDARVGGTTETPGELTLTIAEQANLVGPFASITIEAGDQLFVSSGTNSFDAPLTLRAFGEVVLENGSILSTAGDSITLGGLGGDVRLDSGASSLVTTGLFGGDIVLNPGGVVRTTGDVSDGSLTLSAGTGDIFFDSDVGIADNAPGLLAVSTSGALRLNAQTTRAVATDFSGLTGPIIIDGAAALLSDGVIDLSAARSITALDGGTPASFDLQTPMALSLPTVGSDGVLGEHPLNALTLGSGDLSLGGDITVATLDALGVTGGVTLASDVTINATASGVDLSNATGIDGLTGGEAFTIDADSATLPAIGASTPIGDVSLTTSGGTTLLGDVTTDNGAITVVGPLTIVADIDIVTAGGGVDLSASDVDGSAPGMDLSIDVTPGGGGGGIADPGQVLLAQVGQSQPLGSLDVNAQTIGIAGDVTTDSAGGGTGVQRYAGTTTLTGGARSLLTDGVLTFANGFSAGATNVTLSGGEIDFGGMIGGTGGLTLLGLDAGESFRIGFAAQQAGSVDLTAVELALIESGFSSITIGRDSASAAQSILIGGGGSVSFNNAVVLRAPTVGSSVIVDGNTAVDHSGLLGAFIRIIGSGATTTLRPNSQLLASDAAIDIQTPVLLEGAGARTFAATGAAGRITLAGPITTDSAGSSISFNSVDGGVALGGSIGTLAIPLGTLEVVTAATLELGDGVAPVDLFADAFNLSMVTGSVDLLSSSRLVVSGVGAIDLSNATGITSADGTQSLSLELGAGGAALPGIGATGMRLAGLTASGGPVTLSDSVFVAGGNIDLSGASSAIVLPGGSPMVFDATDGNVLLPMLTGQRAIEMITTGDGATTGIIDFGGVPAAIADVPTSLRFEAVHVDLRGDVRTSGDIDFGSTPTIDVHASIAIDSDPLDSIGGVTPGGNAGTISFGPASIVTAAGPGLNIAVDATADGGGTSGSIVLPGGFFQGFDFTQLMAGLIELDTSIIIEGDLELVGRVEQSATVTIDTNADDLGDSGFIDLDQAVFHATMPGLTLTLDTSSSDGAAGNIDLLAADDFFGSASYLAGVVAQTSGFGPVASVTLSTAIDLDATLAGHGFTLQGGANLLVIKDASIRTGAGGAGDAGLIDLSDSTLVADGSGADTNLLLDTSSGAGAAGDITLGAVDTLVEAFTSFTADASGSAGDGVIRTASGATTFNTHRGFTLIGDVELGGDLTVETTGGAIDLSGAHVSAAAPMTDLTLRVTDSADGDGRITLGTFGNRGGLSGFVDGVAVDTTSASDGTLTLTGDVLISGPTGFTFNGPAVAIEGAARIDTHQAGGSASGPIALNATVFASTGGSTLVLDSSTPGGVATTGGIDVDSFGDHGGAGMFLSAITIDARGDTPGSFATNNDVLLDGNLSVFGIWMLGASTVVNTNADGLGNAGLATFTDTFITDGGSGFDFTIDTSAPMDSNAGSVLLGDLGGLGGVSVRMLTVIADAGNGTPGTGSNGSVIFRSDSTTTSTIAVDSINLDRARGSIVLDVPVTMITTADSTIDLTSAAAVIAASDGSGRLELDAGTGNVMLASSMGQGPGAALGGLIARGGGIEVNGDIAASTAGALPGTILLDGPVAFNTTALLSTTGATIEVTGGIGLLNASTATLRTTDAGAAGGTITLRGDVLAQSASSESLVLDSGDADLQLFASIGTDLLPLAMLEMASSGRVEFGPISGTGAAYVADAIDAVGLTGDALLHGDTRFAVSGLMALDLGNLAHSGASFGINGATPGGQTLTIDAPNATVLLSAIGQQTALDTLSIVSADTLTLRGGARLREADFTGTMIVELDAADGGTIEIIATDGDILFNQDSSISGPETFVLTAIDTTGVTPRFVRVGEVGTNGRLNAFEVTSGDAEFWGDILTGGGDIGIFANGQAMRSITLDTHAEGGPGDAGDVLFAQGGESFEGFAAGLHTLTIDATATGGGANGEIVLPAPFFQDFSHVELRAGEITLTNDIAIEGGLTILSDVVLTGSRVIDTNDDDLGNGGTLNLSMARFFGSAANFALTLDTSTSESGFTGGRVDLGRFDNGGSRSFLGEVLVLADSFAPGTTAADVALHNDVLLDGADPFFGIDSTGIVWIDRGAIVTISLNGDGVANGLGGSIDLAGPTIRSGAAGAGLSLLTAQVGQIDLGRVERGVMGLASLTLESFGGLNVLTDTVETDGRMTIRGALTVIDQTLTLDTAGGLGDFGGTTFAADAGGLDLTIRTNGANGTGVLVLGGVNDSAGAFAGAFINDLSLSAGDRVTLSGDVFLEGFGADTGDFMVLAGGIVRASGARLIDTHQGGASDAGDVLLPLAGTTIDGANASSSLTIDTSSAATHGGDIRLANTLGLASLTLDTTGTLDGVTDLPAMIDISGPVTVRGSLRVSGNSVIATDFDNTGNAADIDLTEATVFASGAGRTLVLDTSSSNGAGGDVMLGLAGDTASGIAGNRLGVLAVSTAGPGGHGDLVLDRTAGDAMIDVVALDLDGGTNPIVYGPMSGFIEVARNSEVITRSRIDLTPVAGVRNIGAGDTVFTLTNLGGSPGNQGIVLPAGGLGTQANPFGEISISTFGSNTILARGDVFTSAIGGASGDASFAGRFMLVSGDARMVFANGGGANFVATMPGGPAIDLTTGALTIMADVVNVFGSITGGPGSNILFKPASGDTIGLGDGVDGSLDLLITRATLGAFSESVGRVTIGNPNASTGTSLIEVGTFDIKTNLSLQTADAGRTVLLGSVTTTGDELRLLGPAFVDGTFSLDTTGPAGTFDGGSFVATRTLDGTTPGAMLNGRLLGTDHLMLTLGKGDVIVLEDTGSTVPLGDITITGGHDVTFYGSVHASSLRQGAAAGTADDGDGETEFREAALFTGTRGVVLETAMVRVLDDLTITGGASRFTSDVLLEGDVLTASQPVVFDRTLVIVEERTIDTTLPLSIGGPASAGAAMDFAFIDGEPGGGKGGGSDATLLLVAGNGDITIGLPGSGGSIVGGVGLNMPNGLAELRIASAGFTAFDGPVRVGGLFQEDGDATSINAPVTTFADGVVEMTTRSRIDVLGSIASDGDVFLEAPAILLASNVSAISDPITFVGSTRVAGDVTVFSGPGFGGDIIFDGTLDAVGAGGNTLTLNSGVAESIFFEGLVGGSAPLDRITIEQAQDVTAREMFTVGELFQTDTQDLTLFEGGLDVLGDADLNGNRYRFETSASFGGDVSITNFGLIDIPAIPVTLGGSFVQDGIGISNVATDLIATDLLSFATNVFVLASAEFGGSSTTFGSDLDVASNAFTITAGEIAFNGGASSIKGSSTLVLQPRSSSAGIDLGSPAGGNAMFSLSTIDLAALRDGFSSITVGQLGGSHTVNIGNAIFRDPTTLRYSGTGGNAIVREALSAVDGAPITLRGSGAGTKLIGDINTVGGDVLIDDAVIIAGEPTSIATAGGDLRVTGLIDAMSNAMGDFVVDAGSVVFEMPLGSTLAPRSIDVSASGFMSKAITTDGATTVTSLNGFEPGGDVTSRTSSISVFGPTLLITDAAFTAGGAGTAITFNGPINGTFNALFSNPLGTVTFAAPVGFEAPDGTSTQLASVTVDAGTINTLSVTTTGSQRYTGQANLGGALRSTAQGDIRLGGPVVLETDVTISTAGNTADDSIIIGQTDGGFALVLNAGAGSITATGTMGTLAPLASLDASASLLSFLTVLSQGNQTYTGDATLNGTYTASAGDLTFNDSISLGGNVEMNGLSLLVDGPVDGAFAFDAATSSSGTAMFNSDIGSGVSLTSLELLTGVATLQNVTTTGFQRYLADVSLTGDLNAGADLLIQRTLTLNSDTLLDANGVSVGGPTNGGVNLTVSAGPGNAAFAAVGNTAPLTSFTLLDAGNFGAGAMTAGFVDLNGVNITTSAPITTSTGGLTVTNTGTWQILSGASFFNLAGNLTQDGTGPTAISRNVAVANDMFFSAPVELRAGNVQLVAANISLLAGVRTDGTPRALVVSAEEVARLSGSFGTDASPLSGFATTDTGRVDFVAADLVSVTGVRFDQPVTVAGDTFIRVTGARNGAGSQNAPAPVAQLGNRQPLPGLSPDSIVFTDVVLGSGESSSLTLLTNLDATGSLIPKIFLGNDVGVAINSTSGLDLSGFGALTTLNLNADPRFSPAPGSGGDRSGHSSVPIVATVMAPTDITIATTDLLRFGRNEKFTTLGSSVFNSAGQTLVGDLTAGGSIFVNSPLITILSRASGPVLELGGVLSNDLGVDFIAADLIQFNGSVSVLAFGPGQITVATLDGAGTSGSLSNFSTRSIDSVSVAVLSLGFDLRSEGSTNTNVSQAIAGAVPRASEGDDVSQAASVSAAQKDVLRKLGVFARDASDAVLRAGLLGRSVYTDYNTPDPQTRRQEVTAQRLDEKTVQAVVDIAQRLLFGIEGETQDVDALSQPTQIMREALNRAVDDWARDEDPQEWDSASLLTYMQSHSEEHADAITALQVLDEVLRQVELIGLSPGEVRDQRSVLLGQIRPVRLKLRQFYELVQLSRDSGGTNPAIDTNILPLG